MMDGSGAMGQDGGEVNTLGEIRGRGDFGAQRAQFVGRQATVCDDRLAAHLHGGVGRHAEKGIVAIVGGSQGDQHPGFLRRVGEICWDWLGCRGNAAGVACLWQQGDAGIPAWIPPGDVQMGRLQRGHVRSKVDAAAVEAPAEFADASLQFDAQRALCERRVECGPSCHNERTRQSFGDECARSAKHLGDDAIRVECPRDWFNCLYGSRDIFDIEPGVKGAQLALMCDC